MCEKYIVKPEKINTKSVETLTIQDNSSSIHFSDSKISHETIMREYYSKLPSKPALYYPDGYEWISKPRGDIRASVFVDLEDAIIRDTMAWGFYTAKPKCDIGNSLKMFCQKKILLKSYWTFKCMELQTFITLYRDNIKQ